MSEERGRLKEIFAPTRQALEAVHRVLERDGLERWTEMPMGNEGGWLRTPEFLSASVVRELEDLKALQVGLRF